MATTQRSSIIVLTVFTLLITLATSSSDKYYETNYSVDVGLHEKITTIHFYYHDILVGTPVTAKRIAGPEDESHFSFLAMLDNPLTAGPEMNSTQIGRAHGLYGSASLTETSLLMGYNIAFSEGELKGSSLSIFGLNSIYLDAREMPVVGGTGLFRFARGYARLRTHHLDPKTFNAIMEYSVTVQHY